MVDMFTACMHPTVKDNIIQEFCDTQSKLRVVIATVTFGMGINCPNVRHVIHWGSPSDIQMYLQETDRGGRDGPPATATLYNISGICHIEESMKLQHFDDPCLEPEVEKDCNYNSLCSCCDICELICTCNLCIMYVV